MTVATPPVPISTNFWRRQGPPPAAPWIFVDRGHIHASDERLLIEPLSGKPDRLYVSNDHMGNWLDCLRSRKRPICDIEIGHRSVTVCHLGNIAYWTRKPIKWDPKAWEFVDPAPEVAKWYDRDRRDPWQLPKV